MSGKKATILGVENGYILEIETEPYCKARVFVFQTLAALAGHIAEYGIGEVKPKVEAVKGSHVKPEAENFEVKLPAEKETLHVKV